MNHQQNKNCVNSRKRDEGDIFIHMMRNFCNGISIQVIPSGAT